MPMKSRAQNRFIHWVDENPAAAKAEGVDPSFAKKFIADSHGQKLSKLPEHVAKKAKGGSVTPRKFVW